MRIGDDGMPRVSLALGADSKFVFDLDAPSPYTGAAHPDVYVQILSRDLHFLMGRTHLASLVPKEFKPFQRGAAAIGISIMVSPRFGPLDNKAYAVQEHQHASEGAVRRALLRLVLTTPSGTALPSVSPASCAGMRSCRARVRCAR